MLLGLPAPASVEFSGRACGVTKGCFSISLGCCEVASRWCVRERGAIGLPREAAHPRGPGGCGESPAACHPVLLPAQRAQTSPWRLAVQTDIEWPRSIGPAHCPTPRNPRNAGMSASTSPEERFSRQKQERKGECVANPPGGGTRAGLWVGGCSGLLTPASPPPLCPHGPPTWLCSPFPRLPGIIGAS